MAKISGSCLCGKVCFESDNRFEKFHFCHCTQCQKATGSAHASNLFTDPNNINWLRGLAFVKRYDVPGRSITTAFCSECGCSLPYISGTGKALIVPAGCLDSQPSLDPQANIFCTEQATWYKKGLNCKQFAMFSE